jgi:hypothetical protein
MKESAIGKIEKIQNIDKSLLSVIEQNLPKIPSIQPNEAYFRALMERVDKHENLQKRPDEVLKQRGDRDILANTDNKYSDKRTSLIDEINKVSGKIETLEFFKQPMDMRIQNIQTNANKAIVQIDEAKEILNNPNLRLKKSVDHILEKRIGNVHNDLSSAYSKMGMEYAPLPASGNELITPVRKFLGYLVSGQTRLEQLKNDVQAIDKESFSMADMLSMQIKVAHVSQEMEFFTSLLNKALESTKALMNVQI